MSHRQGRPGDAGKRKHVIAKPNLVSPNDPTQQCGCKAIEGHEHAVDRPFLLNQSCISNKVSSISILASRKLFLTGMTYKTMSPGMDWSATSDAAVNCQALLPVSSHFGVVSDSIVQSFPIGSPMVEAANGAKL